jgi:RNA polymerase sigma-54 factor
MEQRQSLILEQRLKLSPQLFQSLRLMELPVTDLREKIEEEIEKNPALEVLDDPAEVSLDAAYSPRKEEDDYFEGSSDSGFIGRGGEEESEEHRKFLEGAVARPETLQEHLLWQLVLETADDDVRRIGERLIQNLDADGFHKEPLDLLLAGEHKAKIEEALRLVRSLDPPGTCTSGYPESLRVQAALLKDPPECIGKALDYLEQLERGKFAETAKILGYSEEELEACFERIKELSPFPGRQFTSEETRYAVPDVQVIRKDGEFVIILNSEEIPVLGINPFFMKIDNGSRDESGKETRDFVRENIKEARWFIQSINQRNHTMLRVSRAIVEFQRAFFAKGPKFLVPLTLRDIANELGVHETTISRTSNGKYMQTEWGIYELRYFFTNSITGTGSAGSRFSKEGVKEIIKEIITGAEPSLVQEEIPGERRRFSDQELADMLAQRGISLARRTVAKYRNELDLGSSYTR